MPGARGGKFAAGFTLLEVLVGVSLFTIGMIGIMALFPTTLRNNERVELRTLGAGLALMKIEEVRRDNDQGDKLMNAIRSLTEPTDPVEFAHEPRLSYRFSSTTVLYQKRNSSGSVIDDPADPRDDPGVPRVIIEESARFTQRPKVLDEYRFN